MTLETPLFAGLNIETLNKKRQTSVQKVAAEVSALKQKSLTQLSHCFNDFIPHKELEQSQQKEHSRHRLYSKSNTFWAFFSQSINADGGCKEVVKKVQAYAALKNLKQPDSSTSAYCQARQKLLKSDLKNILNHTSERLEDITDRGFLNGRRVVVVDGTGVSMPDTVENQERWPQQSHQKEGCGFPSARICAFFSLATAGLLSFEIGNKKSAELPLFRKQWGTFRSGDIFLGDKGFCSYFDQSNLRDRGVDSIITLARRLPKTEIDAEEKLGENDLLITWLKPAWNSRGAYSREQWEDLPATLKLRQIHVKVTLPGFRTESFYIVTTLTDPKQYQAEEISDLYLRRWEVELYFKDIKTTMGMDILRCKSPDMVEKEIIMHFIAYNGIRKLMYEAGEECDIELRRISFKGSLQALRQWEPYLNQADISKKERFRLLSALYDAIADDEVPYRPGRQEPRCVKRRPKPYQLLTKHRHQMKEIPHRSKYRAKQALT